MSIGLRHSFTKLRRLNLLWKGFHLLAFPSFQILADRSARTTWLAIGMLMWSVCLSVSLSLSLCLSVCDAVHCCAQGRCIGLKVNCTVLLLALSIHFFKHFCYRMYSLATKHSDLLKKLTGVKRSLPTSKAYLCLKLQTSEYSCWLRLFQTTVCSYAVRCTQYDRLLQ